MVKQSRKINKKSSVRGKKALTQKRLNKQSGGNDCELTIEKLQLMKIAMEVLKKRNINPNILENDVGDKKINTIIEQILNPDSDQVFGFGLENMNPYISTNNNNKLSKNNMFYISPKTKRLLLLKSKIRINR
jgi:hypothetical protein